MKKVYATYRPKPLNQWSWLYTPSYFFDVMFGDYKQAWLTYINDVMIWDDRYVWELVPWVLKRNRLLVWYYNDEYVQESDFRASLITTGSEFHISLFDNLDEVKQWIRDNTDLIEESDGKFIINEATEEYPINYLIIE